MDPRRRSVNSPDANEAAAFLSPTSLNMPLESPPPESATPPKGPIVGCTTFEVISATRKAPAPSKFWRKHIKYTFLCYVMLFVPAIFVINPEPSLWKLHQSIPEGQRPRILILQLTFIGLLLALMELCSAPTREAALLLWESHHKKIPKNYLAIMTEGTFSGKGWWWVVLGFFKIAPPVLGVLYKQFDGGEARGAWDSVKELGAGLPRYGVDFPRVGAWSPPNDSIYFLLTSIAAFQTASGHGKASYPNASSFPIAYGYNTVLLSNDSAAVLDIPTGTYMDAIQKQLRKGEKVEINADVDAYITNLNTSSQLYVRDNTLWNAAFNASDQEIRMTSISLFKYKGQNLGIMPLGEAAGMFIGVYYNSTYDRVMRTFWNSSDPQTANEHRAFRDRAQLYNIKRGRCHGKWELNSTSILLKEGHCNDRTAVVNQDILHKLMFQPFHYDILPPLVHTYEHLVSDRPENPVFDSPWLQATYSVTVASIYWARAKYMTGRSDHPKIKPPVYEPLGENLYLVKEVLKPHPGLYVILMFHPVVTLLSLGYLWLKGKPRPQSGKELLGLKRDGEWVEQRRL